MMIITGITVSHDYNWSDIHGYDVCMGLDIYFGSPTVFWTNQTLIIFNPFPHIDTFWRLCSRRLFENIVTKEEIAQNMQFLLLPQCFQLFVIGYPFNYNIEIFYVLTKYILSVLLQNCRMRERDHLVIN